MTVHFFVKTSAAGEQRTGFFSRKTPKAAFAKTADKVFFSTLAQCAFKEKSERLGRGRLLFGAEKRRQKRLFSIIDSQPAARHLPDFFLKRLIATSKEKFFVRCFRCTRKIKTERTKPCPLFPCMPDFEYLEGIVAISAISAPRHEKTLKSLKFQGFVLVHLQGFEPWTP